MHNGQPLRVGVIGASGYSGMELVKILAGHPGVEVALAASDRWAGERVGDRLPIQGPVRDLVFVPPEEARFESCALVFLATPAEASLEAAPRALEAGARVIDLSGAFRLEPEDYPRWYGFDHPRPALCREAVYGLTELDRGALREARLVANPGCYATAAALALRPLLEAGVVEREGLVVDAASGVTGAGRKATEDLSFAEIEGDFRAYRILRHQHTPEIERTLGARVTFTTHLLPVRRGILATAHGRLARGRAPAEVADAVQSFARGRPFVQARDPERIGLKAVVGTNLCLVGAVADPERGSVLSFAALDNLLKGAAGQAVQNMNRMLGFEETTGLTSLQGAYP